MKASNSCDVLLVCATSVECDAILAEAPERSESNGANNIYYHLGSIGHTDVALVLCQMGSGTLGGSLLTIHDAIKDCTPKFIIMAGIAFGMNSNKQTIGQVLVAEACQAYDPEKVGKESTISRGSRIPVQAKIVQAFKATARTFSPIPIFGLMLSGSKLIDSPDFKQHLTDLAPEAIGGDMEIDGLANAALQLGIPWGAAKGICDFADGTKQSASKDADQREAAANSARFVIEAIRRGYFSNHLDLFSSAFDTRQYSGDAPDSRLKQLGLVDLALQRRDLSWNYLSKSLDALIESISAGGEYFIVARSMETWLQIPEGHTHSYLDRLARKAVEKSLRCTFVLPERDAKSLVLGDPSQGVREHLWQHIETVLKNAIDESASQTSTSDGDLEHGVIEIYTIPAYVPSTFSKVSTKDGVEYCSLEVGIGIPPEEDRVMLYFENNHHQRNAFERLVTIYKGIINEREPLYKFPTAKRKPPEHPFVLSKLYENIKSSFQAVGFHVSHCYDEPDWFTYSASAECGFSINSGSAALLSTLPLGGYIGGRGVLASVGKLRDELSNLFSKDPDEYGKVDLFNDNDLLIPVFYYKSSFSGLFSSPFDSTAESAALVNLVSQHKPFRVAFKHFGVDHFGRLLLLGYIHEADVPDVSALRSDLLDFSKGQCRRFQARRPRDVVLPFGRVQYELSHNALLKLQLFSLDHFNLTSECGLEVDQLRLVRLDGDFSNYFIKQIGEPITLKTTLLEGTSFESYGVIVRGKWLAHDRVVKSVCNRDFQAVRPVTVHFAPSLDCIYNCPTCSYGSVQHVSAENSDRQMEWGDMYSSITKLKRGDVRGIIFTGGGEPLTNEETLRGMLYARSIGLSVGLFTNGYLKPGLSDSGQAKTLRTARRGRQTRAKALFRPMRGASLVG